MVPITTPGICAEFVELYCGNEVVDIQNPTKFTVIQTNVSRQEVLISGSSPCKTNFAGLLL